jgi:glycosyltransferase involved in cell wall biosynthesis
MADKVVRLIKDYDLGVLMGQRGRKRVIEEFSIEEQANRFIEMYNSLV